MWGVERAGHGADPPAHISKLIWDFKKGSCSLTGFRNLDFLCCADILSFVRTQTFSVNSAHSFIHETPDLT